MVCLADTLHNPDLRPETDCVWGPEVLEDELTRAADPLRRGYLSEVFNAEWCMCSRSARRAPAQPACVPNPRLNEHNCCGTVLK